MINVAARGYTKQILEAADIYKVAYMTAAESS
jgi:hypothetical protein